MTGDEERRRKARAAKLGDPAAVASVERDQRRVGEGVLAFLDELVGKRVYVEGVRINLRGTLRQVLVGGDGMPAGLILQPCQRVSYFAKRGPDVNYAYTHTRPHLVPWDSVHDLGEEGFLEGVWPEPPEAKS